MQNRCQTSGVIYHKKVFEHDMIFRLHNLHRSLKTLRCKMSIVEEKEHTLAFLQNSRDTLKSLLFNLKVWSQQK